MDKPEMRIITDQTWLNEDGLVIARDVDGDPSFDIFDAGEWPGTQAEGFVIANLIAAAPELLSACEAALSDLEDCWKNGVKKGYQRQRILSLPSLRAAIAKAKGGA